MITVRCDNCLSTSTNTVTNLQEFGWVQIDSFLGCWRCASCVEQAERHQPTVVISNGSPVAEWFNRGTGRVFVTGAVFDDYLIWYRAAIAAANPLTMRVHKSARAE